MNRNKIKHKILEELHELSTTSGDSRTIDVLVSKVCKEANLSKSQLESVVYDLKENGEIKQSVSSVIAIKGNGVKAYRNKKYIKETRRNFRLLFGFWLGVSVSIFSVWYSVKHNHTSGLANTETTPQVQKELLLLKSELHKIQSHLQATDTTFLNTLP